MLAVSGTPGSQVLTHELNALSSAVHQINNDEKLLCTRPQVLAKRLVAPLSSLVVAGAVGYCSLVIAAMTAGLSILMMAAATAVVYVGVSLTVRLVTKSPGGRLIGSVDELEKSSSNMSRAYDDCKPHVSGLAERIRLQDDHIRTMEARCLDLDINNSRLATELEQARHESRNRYQREVLLDSELAVSRSNDLAHRARAEELEVLLDQARKDIQSQQDHAVKLQTQLHEAWHEVEGHQARTEQSKALLEQVRKELESQQGRVAQLDQELKRTCNENRSLEVRADKLKKLCKDFVEEKEQALMSENPVMTDIAAQTETIDFVEAETQCAAEILIDAKHERQIPQSLLKAVDIQGKARQVLDPSHRPGRRQPFPVATGGENLNTSQREDLEYRWVPGNRIAEKLEKALARAQKQKDAAQVNKDMKYDFLGQKAVRNKFRDLQQVQGKIDVAKCQGTTISVDFMTSDTLLQTGIACSKGVRTSMEDQDIHEAFNLEVNGVTYPVQMTGIFDGHNGALWPKYAKQHIVGHLQRRVEGFSANGASDESIFNALKLALVDLVVSRQDEYPLNKAGTTANLVLCLNGSLWCVNTGDSRAILVDSDDHFLQLSEDAKPDTTHYTSSIYKRGGVVKMVKGEHRINGKLASGRALGDVDLGPGISPRPKLTKIPEDQYRGKWLIQVCDGVTDVATTHEIGTLATELLNAGNSPAVTAAKLVASAIKAGSKDNLSVIVRRL